jgi:D-arabinose 1-dehydrogenase-like Zn-dependent alcohol dehydrogenase
LLNLISGISESLRNDSMAATRLVRPRSIDRILSAASIVVASKERSNMQTLEDQRVVVTGGSRGLGLGIVEALVARRAKVTVLARDPDRLAEVQRRLGVGVAVGDVSDPDVAERVIREIKPSVLVLNAGTSPALGRIHELLVMGKLKAGALRGIVIDEARQVYWDALAEFGDKTQEV